MTPPEFLFAIDPGLHGAIVYLRKGKLEWVNDVPLRAKKSGRDEVDSRAVGTLFDRCIRNGARYCLIERVSAMPRDGVMGAFGFGDTFGAIRAVAEDRCRWVSYVAPAVWKKDMGVTKDKDYSRTLALRLFPEAQEVLARKKDHSRAEALLLGRYAIRNFAEVFQL